MSTFYGLPGETMNWTLSLLVVYLLSPAFSELTCLKNENCFCQMSMDHDDMEVICNNSVDVKLKSMHSLVQIQCQSEKMMWHQVFNQINITTIDYKNCHLPDRGFRHTFSLLGINDFQIMRLNYIKLYSSFGSVYLSNLQNVKHLEISVSKADSKLILTNDTFNGTPNLIKLFLRSNNIDHLPKYVFKQLTALERLDLGGNKLTNLDPDLFNGIPLKILNLDSNSLTTLSLKIQSLIHLELSNNKLTAIDVDNLNNLKHLYLNKNVLTRMKDKPFTNTSLETLNYKNGNFTIPNKFLTDLNQLHIVTLISLNLEVLPENIFWGSRNIKSLLLSSNRLKNLPVLLFQDSENIIELDLSKNLIEDINQELFRPLKKLEKLDLSRNYLTRINTGLKYSTNLVNLNLAKNKIWTFDYAALNLPKLKELKMADNQIVSLASNLQFSLQYLENVENLDLAHNKITSIDPGWVNLVKLKNVNLSNNNISKLSIEDLQYFVHIETDFSSNPLQTVNLSGLDVIANSQTSMYNTKKIVLSSHTFSCDCDNYEFGRYLHKLMTDNMYKYLKIEQDLTCNNGMSFKDVSLDSLTCGWDQFDDENKTDCSECICTYRPFDNSAIMNCSNSNLKLAPTKIITSKNLNYTELNLRNNLITELPDYTSVNIGKLDVGNNSLNFLNMSCLPRKLIELNMGHNELQSIESSLSSDTEIFNNLNRVILAGNPWLCNCETKYTISLFHKYAYKITDYSNVTCSSSTLLQNLLVDDLCHKSTILMATSICIALIGLSLGLLFAIYYRYKIEIKVWLYAHHIRWPMAEESIDSHKLYDAFISYSHKDEDFVAKQLIPGLEGGENSFKLCLHSRDWVVGDWIPAQIARSVDESRRTIIVLSSNFLESIWGRMEFRTAHSSALKERRSRVIIILYGDVPTEALDPELKAYLSMNTYVKWGDYLFWEKLKYALPHRHNEKKKPRSKIIIPDKLNPLVLA
ncbi:protein toll-like [Adelges cooleyi]|uniref:protein toll-like n=1 Tax=Adelges cooleyi TaxID=133065 RepID=UPI00217F873E|nr:protein toll-like [Adelges cooleyi]